MQGAMQGVTQGVTEGAARGPSPQLLEEGRQVGLLPQRSFGGGLLGEGLGVLLRLVLRWRGGGGYFSWGALVL